MQSQTSIAMVMLDRFYNINNEAYNPNTLEHQRDMQELMQDAISHGEFSEERAISAYNSSIPKLAEGYDN